MPYSSDVYDQLVSLIVDKLSPRTCLDIGAGAGKYGKLIKQRMKNQTHVIGIEIENDYIGKFELHEIYDKVLCIDALTLLDIAIEERYDLVIIGDTIEHLRKSAGIDLINFLIYRISYLILIYPIKYLQNSVDGYMSEAHVSVWGKSDFTNFEHTEVIQHQQQLIVIKGYIKSEFAISDIEKLIKGYFAHE